MEGVITEWRRLVWITYTAIRCANVKTSPVIHIHTEYLNYTSFLVLLCLITVTLAEAKFGKRRRMKGWSEQMGEEERDKERQR